MSGTGTGSTTLDTFNFLPPSYQGGNEEVNPRLQTLDFGDGYTQVVVDGLNASLLTVTYTWDVLPRATCEQMLAWLRAHVGAIFYWTLPGSVDGPQKFYTPNEGWKRTKSGPMTDTLTINFKQVVTNLV